MHDKKRKFLLFSIVGFSYFFMNGVLSFADLHLTKEQKTTWKDHPRKFESVTEIWKTGDKEYRKFRDRIFITRRDLKKVWMIDLKTKQYTESSLEKPKPPRPRGPKEKLHNEGYDYKPDYDWIIQKTEEEKEICGLLCKKLLIDGDADFSEKIIELWITDDIGIDFNLYKDLHKYFQGSEAFALTNKFEELKDQFILKETVRTVDPIASESISEQKYTTVEDIPAPEGIYELPDGLKKVESLTKGRMR
jgi:hypothetical protein